MQGNQAADHLISRAVSTNERWNFSAPDAVRETEDYAVELFDVMILELNIVPDTSGGPARASLLSLRVA